MSVSGEFKRAVADCVTLWRGSGAPGAEALARQLEASARGVDASLPARAGHVFEQLQSVDAELAFGSELEREDFGRAAEHARALCQVILGR